MHNYDFGGLQFPFSVYERRCKTKLLLSTPSRKNKASEDKFLDWLLFQLARQLHRSHPQPQFYIHRSMANAQQRIKDWKARMKGSDSQSLINFVGPIHPLFFFFCWDPYDSSKYVLHVNIFFSPRGHALKIRQLPMQII